MGHDKEIRVINGIKVEGSKKEWEEFEKGLKKNKYNSDYKLSPDGFYVIKNPTVSG